MTTSKWVNQWIVPASSADKDYTISQDNEGGWACSCRGWTGHVPRTDCKHIRFIKARISSRNVSSPVGTGLWGDDLPLAIAEHAIAKLGGKYDREAILLRMRRFEKEEKKGPYPFSR